MKKVTLIWISVIWLLLILASGAWNHYMIVSGNENVVHNKARSFFEQILVTRAWNSAQGGIYVPVTDKTQPNPFLRDSLRDLTSHQGIRLTKVNPAYMTRLIAELNKSENDLRFHITSLKPIRPANKADEWEKKALESFKSSKDEILELSNYDSVKSYRYMAPLITAKSCLTCHEYQGYKVGDVRGGISISFPAQVYLDTVHKQLAILYLAHFAILIFGFAGIFLYRKMSNSYHSIIEQKNKNLEIEVAERKLAEQEIIVKNKALESLHIEKDKFFSILAHDLRSPFNSFLGLTLVMAKEYDKLSAEEIQAIAGSMHNSATKLLRLLENLLDWSRIKNGTLIVTPENLLLKNVVAESLSLFAESEKSKELCITVDIPENLMVSADLIMIQSICNNMISNAVKFTPIKGYILITAAPSENNFIRVSVKDSGIGMSKFLLDNLFRIDVQTSRKGTEGESSSGLGLLLCKEFIEKLGGTISVISRENQGSEFIFTLPEPVLL